jgi:MoxR-like ATPase
MQEQRVTVANTTYRLDAPFFVLATQNPLEMEGTYPLPEAQLDRFMFKINVLFPSAQELMEIFNRTTSSYETEVQPVVNGDDIITMGQVALGVPMPSNVNEYVARLVVATHPGSPEASPLVDKYVRYGSSPRGGQSIILGAKVNALLEGRYNVSYEDVATVAPSALRHRLLLNFEGQAERITTDEVISELLNTLDKG